MSDPSTDRAQADRVAPESALLRDLSSEQRAAVEAMLVPVDVAGGEFVFAEGDPGDALYLVDRGRFEITRAGVPLATVGPGGEFGSVALIDGEARSASVRALEAGALRRLALDDLERLAAADDGRFYAQLLHNMLRGQNDNLRRSSETAVASLRAQLEESEKRVAMGSFLASLIFLVCVYGFFLRGSVDSITLLGESTLVSAAIVFFYAATLLAMMWRSPFPLSTYGLTLSGWRPALRESLLWSLGFAVAATAAKAAAIHWLPAWAGEPLFSPFAASEASPLGGLALGTIYALFAPFQEFVARGALQSSFQVFLGGRYVTARAIVLSSLLFATTHLHVSTAFAVLALVPSLFWGVLYARQRTLVGVCVSHVVIGLWVIFAMGVPGIR